MTMHVISGSVMLSVPFGLTNSTSVPVPAPINARTSISNQSMFPPETNTSTEKIPNHQNAIIDPMKPKTKTARVPGILLFDPKITRVELAPYFIPIGAVQGWDPESYKNAVKELQEMNYEYIALGGLARSNTKTVLSILF